MELILGQIDKPKPNLKDLIVSIDNGLADNYDVTAKECRLAPLSWAISINLASNILHDRKEFHSMALVHAIAQFLGPGTYYVRGVENSSLDLQDFWDTREEVSMNSIGLMWMMPVSFTIGNEGSYFNLYFSWVTDFLKKNVNGRFKGHDEENLPCVDHPFFRVLFDISLVFNQRGPWRIRIVYEESKEFVAKPDSSPVIKHFSELITGQVNNESLRKTRSWN